ncbi:glycosyltransferase family 9 protein [Thalassotalea agarivorans]|uniref:Heptosyltransferase I n=1 Tax=Thalassotalea agarivorans TaxID=349064 RepID=A0A1I0CNV0_THASX|nr:glycosyltransferase family 9 protein [Thalassotalea agarivorans]SET20913.1 heptosyltransferase I [Thalassotalea agarivorans]
MTDNTITLKNICILRLSAIGDVCHAVALVQYLQQQLPQCKITWIVGKVEAQLIKSLNLSNVSLVAFDKKAGLKSYFALKRQLNGQEFDALLHMQTATRASAASLFIKAKRKIGFDVKRSRELQRLFVNEFIAEQENPHVAEGFMAFAQALGLPYKQPTWSVKPDAQSSLWANNIVTSNRPIALICASASKDERNWHTEHYAAVADHIHNQGYKVILVGGNTQREQALSENIIAKSTTKPASLVGKTSLPQLLAIIDRARFIVAPDTGPVHMAVMVNTPVIGLYAHSNPDRTGPYLYPQYTISCYQQHIEAQQHKSLADIPWGKRAKGEDLMDSISLPSVIDTIDKVITTQLSATI